MSSYLANYLNALSAAKITAVVAAIKSLGGVFGPASAVSGNVATFSGTTGKVVQDGGKALPSGAIVGTSDTQTLTNKAITDATAITMVASSPVMEITSTSAGEARIGFDLFNASGARDVHVAAVGSGGQSNFVVRTASGATPVEQFRVGHDGKVTAPGGYSVTTASAANVNVASDGVLARSTSSEKYKTNIEPMADTYADAIFEMVPIWYRSTCERDDPDWSWWGLSAEAVAAIDPRLVHWRTHEMVTDIIEVEREVDGEVVTEMVAEQKAVALAVPVPEGVAYDRLTVFLISIAQRQQSRIDTLERRLAALEGAA